MELRRYRPCHISRSSGMVKTVLQGTVKGARRREDRKRDRKRDGKITYQRMDRNGVRRFPEGSRRQEKVLLQRRLWRPDNPSVLRDWGERDDFPTVFLIILNIGLSFKILGFQNALSSLKIPLTAFLSYQADGDNGQCLGCPWTLSRVSMNTIQSVKGHSSWIPSPVSFDLIHEFCGSCPWTRPTFQYFSQKKYLKIVQGVHRRSADRMLTSSFWPRLLSHTWRPKMNNSILKMTQNILLIF